MRILLIEDDSVLGAAVRDQIIGDGHSVDWVTRIDAARDAMAGAAYDLILLDLMLPDGRGIVFLRALRVAGDVTPIIILTALDQVSDRIEGLTAGATTTSSSRSTSTSCRRASAPSRADIPAIPTRSYDFVRSTSTSPAGACAGTARPFN